MKGQIYLYDPTNPSVAAKPLLSEKEFELKDIATNGMSLWKDGGTGLVQWAAKSDASVSFSLF